jgi:hypothetical protein
MSAQSSLRPLILSFTLALAGATAVVGLPPLAGTPSLAATGAVAPAVDPVSVGTAAAASVTRARVAPTGLAPEGVAAVLREQRAAGLDCELSSKDVPLCVHGEDHEPVSRHTAAGTSAGTTASGGQIGCYGTGNDGPRIRAVYARPQSSVDRYASSIGSIRSWAAGVSRQFDTSAVRTGGRRHVRFATTAGAGCAVTVLNVVLPDSAFRTFRSTIDALEARGLDAPFSKYLVWADTSGYCGMATTYADDSPGLDNLNNGNLPSYARVDRSCWGKVEAHELVHMLGGVQQSARNSTGGFHCNDGFDVMCYDDGTARSTQRSVCGKDGAVLLDCRNDDYFSTAAPARTYLQTHWNTARSSFLAPTLSDPAPAASSSPAPRTDPSPSASPSPSPSPSGAIVPATTLPAVADLLPPLPTPLPAAPVPAAQPVVAVLDGAL